MKLTTPRGPALMKHGPPPFPIVDDFNKPSWPTMGNLHFLIMSVQAIKSKNVGWTLGNSMWWLTDNSADGLPPIVDHFGKPRWPTMGNWHFLIVCPSNKNNNVGWRLGSTCGNYLITVLLALRTEVGTLLKYKSKHKGMTTQCGIGICVMCADGDT